MTAAVGRRTRACGIALTSLVAAGAFACAAREGPAGPPPARAGGLSPPSPVAVTPARLDAYVLAMRNIRAAHPAPVEIGRSPTELGQAVREAVAAAGLRLEEFLEIHREVQADPALRAEAESRIAAPATPHAPSPSPGR